MVIVVVADVETCAEDFDVQAVGRHDERRPAVVLDLEIGFTLHLHAALARKEGGDVLHAARRIEPHLRPVGQHHLRPLAQLGDDGHGLRQALGKQHGREPAGQEHRGDHGRSGNTHRAPAQGDTASGVHAALELPERTFDVDTGRIVDTVADIQYIINLAEHPAVCGRAVVPRLYGLRLRRVQLALQEGDQYLFVDFEICHAVCLSIK